MLGSLIPQISLGRHFKGGLSGLVVSVLVLVVGVWDVSAEGTHLGGRECSCLGPCHEIVQLKAIHFDLYIIIMIIRLILATWGTGFSSDIS